MYKFKKEFQFSSKVYKCPLQTNFNLNIILESPIYEEGHTSKCKNKIFKEIELFVKSKLHNAIIVPSFDRDLKFEDYISIKKYFIDATNISLEDFTFELYDRVESIIWANNNCKNIILYSLSLSYLGETFEVVNG